MTGLARSFLGEFAACLEEEGVRLESAALDSPWHIGKVEQHDGVWKSMVKCMAQEKQFSGKEAVRTAVIACTKAKHTMSRWSVFSPYLWVLGRDIGLPANLCDEGEVERVSEMVAAAHRGSHSGWRFAPHAGWPSSKPTRRTA